MAMDELQDLMLTGQWLVLILVDKTKLVLDAIACAELALGAAVGAVDPAYAGMIGILCVIWGMCVVWGTRVWMYACSWQHTLNIHMCMQHTPPPDTPTPPHAPTPTPHAGHYLVLCGYDVASDTFSVKDPAADLPTVSLPSSVLEAARKTFGTDEDIILVRYVVVGHVGTMGGDVGGVLCVTYRMGGISVCFRYLVCCHTCVYYVTGYRVVMEVQNDKYSRSAMHAFAHEHQVHM